MKTGKKALVLSLCLAALAVGSAVGTMAYLTDHDAATNTFTVGSVTLTLDEADVKTDGTYENGHDQRVQENTYHLLPGHTYYKDPTVIVGAGSADAYVRMIVKVEGMDQLKLAIPNSGNTADYYGADEKQTFLLQKLCVDENGTCTWDGVTWEFESYTESVEEKEETGSAVQTTTVGIYEFRYRDKAKEENKGIVEHSETKTTLPDLFTHITVPGELDNEHLAYLKNVKITVNAHAIQADGFENDEDGAWEAFGTQNKNK